MEMTITDDERLFREEVRTWLEENKPKTARPRSDAGMREFDLAWQRTQYEAGWAGISWPKEYGGRGLSLNQQIIWVEECFRARAPAAGACRISVNHAGPTLIARATDAQKAFHLPKILKGEAVWCQGFSEPGAGSDLAAIRTSGVVRADRLVVNGQKIWTSYGHLADYQELLIRTDPSLPRHKGLTWVICDMRAPGITVQPIRNIVGEHHFNQVFYDDVEIPLSNVVGGLNQGWDVALSTLGFERGTATAAEQVEISDQLEKLIEFARTHPGPRGDGPAIEDRDIAAKLAKLRAEVSALRAMIYMMISRLNRTGAPGLQSSIVRLYFAEARQRIARVASDILGVGGLERTTSDGVSSIEFINSLRTTIAGGTAEIQRNIIAERFLGLPRTKN